MEQTVTLKVRLDFVAEHPPGNYIDELLSNVKEALVNWTQSSEAGLCPQDAEGYTKDIVVFFHSVYKEGY